MRKIVSQMKKVILRRKNCKPPLMKEFSESNLMSSGLILLDLKLPRKL